LGNYAVQFYIILYSSTKLEIQLFRHCRKCKSGYKIGECECRRNHYDQSSLCCFFLSP